MRARSTRILALSVVLMAGACGTQGTVAATDTALEAPVPEAVVQNAGWGELCSDWHEGHPGEAPPSWVGVSPEEYFETADEERMSVYCAPPQALGYLYRAECAVDAAKGMGLGKESLAVTAQFCDAGTRLGRVVSKWGWF